MLVVRLGNDNPMMQVQTPAVVDGEAVIVQSSVPARHLNQSITTVEFWDGIDDPDFVDLTLSTDNDRILSMIARQLGSRLRICAVAVNEVEQLMVTHSGGMKPAWVASDDALLEEALAKHFDCPRGEPVALLTNLGRDNLHAQHLGTSAQPAACNYMGLSANATAPSAATTTLPGEITTAGGGLIRAQATYAHTGGTNTSTLTKTFTANGTDALPVTLAKMGVMNHITTAATCCYETLLSATATLTISGDSIAITETVTAG
jgi:hypothetical protein